MKLSRSGYSKNIKFPDIQIYIDGVKYTQCNVADVVMAAGLEGATITLNFPLLQTYNYNFKDNDLVAIYIDRRIQGRPFFLGYIRSYEENNAGEGMSIVCQDLRCRLSEGMLKDKNYNVIDEDGEILRDSNGLVKEWGRRDILQDIVSEYNTFAAGDTEKLFFSFANIANDFVGEKKFDGITFAAAIESLINADTSNRYFAIIEYTQGNNANIKFIDYTQGRGRADIIAGTKNDKAINAQPFGIAGAGEISTAFDLFTNVNYLTAYSSNIVVETALPLNRGWSSSIEDDVMENYSKYTEKGDKENPNSSYNPNAEFVWRRFTIPLINDYGKLRRPAHYKNLISSWHNIVDDNGNRITLKNFVVVDWGDDVLKVMTDGYKIENNKYVVFNEPIFQTNNVGGIETAQKPVNVYLNFAFVSQQRYYTTVSSGAGGHKLEVCVSNNSFFHWYEKNNYVLTGVSGEANTVSYNSSGRVARNDKNELAAFAAAELKKISETKKFHTITLPRFETRYKLGERVYVNGIDYESPIINIRYDFLNFQTILEVGDR